jgi:hypothetical protein
MFYTVIPSVIVMSLNVLICWFLSFVLCVALLVGSYSGSVFVFFYCEKTNKKKA